MSLTILPTELAALLAQKTEIILLDVRGADEIALAGIDGAMNIPLDQLASRIAEIPRQAPIVTICHHGVRSVRAAEFLRQNGYNEVRSLAGGVDAWAVKVDPTVPRY